MHFALVDWLCGLALDRTVAEKILFRNAERLIPAR